jgi:predicted dehydrogenase
LRKIRVAVVGAGSFGQHHLRVLRESGRAELVAVVDTDGARAQEAAQRFACEALEDARRLAGRVEAAVVAVPTSAHAEVGGALLEAGIDVLVEKPIAADPASARRLVETAEARGRVLQVGHLERFNPAVAALRSVARLPLFFEVHRLSVFTPRSLDVDVVLDLMIHDLDIVLSLTGQMPEEIRAAGISILSRRVDIANVRLAFPGGCVANLTASRVSTERVRKLRMFQPHQYVSLDYTRQDALVLEVSPDRQLGSRLLAVEKAEPLALELEAFLEAVETRRAPAVSGAEACRALEVALAILDKIEEHSRLVAHTLESWKS